MKLLVGQLVAALLIALNPAAETHSTCPADWPVDELIAVLNKRPLHVKNPLPDTACINLWLIVPVGTCHEVKKSSPPENPNPEPAPEPSTIASSSNDAGPASAPRKIGGMTIRQPRRRAPKKNAMKRWRQRSTSM